MHKQYLPPLAKFSMKSLRNLVIVDFGNLSCGKHNKLSQWWGLTL